MRLAGIFLPMPVLAASLLVTSAPAASAAPAACPHMETFNAAEFAAAQNTGQAIVVAFGADWCPVCSRQGALLSQLAGERTDCTLLIVHLDYDDNRAVARSLGVDQQGTVVGLRGTREVARIVGVSDRAAIRAFLDKVQN